MPIPRPERRLWAWRLGLVAAGLGALWLASVIALPEATPGGLNRGKAAASGWRSLLRFRSASDETALASHPLFEPSRQPWSPLAAGGAARSLPDAAPPPPRDVLVGLVSSATKRIALLRDNTGKVRLVRPGDSVGGWTVEAIDSEGVTLRASKARFQIVMLKRRF